MIGESRMKQPEDMGIVFNIQHYCIHDGPGIRTNVFLTGCPLRCLWCANPESQELRPQLMYRADTCLGCGRCIGACPNHAVAAYGGKVKTDRSRCLACGACVGACPAGAREISGKLMTADGVLDEVAEDKMFYDSSGGGITLTGGEPLAQPDFARVILSKCRQQGIGTAIETTGFARWDVFKEILRYTDIVLYDLKHMDSAAHKKFTGADNALILENIVRVSAEAQLPIVARVPVIGGCNDSEENFHRIGQFLSSRVPTCHTVNLLPYHKLGVAKSEQLERDGPAFQGREPGNPDRLRSILESYGLKAT
jgi:pyruvate formate lyase activating enzyme